MLDRRLLSDPMRVLRFLCTGGIAACVQLVILDVLVKHGWSDTVANLVAFLLSAQLNFALSSTFTWRDRSTAAPLWRRWLVFHGAIAGMAVFNMMVFALAHTVLPALEAAALGIAAAAMGNFILGDRLVFRRTSSRRAIPQGDIAATRDTAWASPGCSRPVAEREPASVPASATTAQNERPLRAIVRQSNGVLVTGPWEPVGEHIPYNSNGYVEELHPEKEPPMAVLSRHEPVLLVDQPVFSIVAPVYNEEETLPRFYDRITAVMQDLHEPYELVLIDDGSKDGSAGVLRDLHARDSHVRVVHFSRNFGHQIAISAGLDYARGRAVVIIDSDLQDPPEVIPELIDRWRAGIEVVYAQRRARPGETRFKLLTAAAFYRLIRRLTSMDIPRDTGDFRLLDRRVVDTLIAMHEHHRFMRGLSVWVGFRQEPVLYDRQERYAGATKYPLMKMVRFAVDAITGFSYVPLQLATTLGFVLAGLSLVGVVVAVVLRLLNMAIQGQTTTLITVLFLGGIQLIFLGIIGEYLGRIYDEVRDRPLYIAREVLDS